jgi:hypothetical protein
MCILFFVVFFFFGEENEKKLCWCTFVVTKTVSFVFVVVFVSFFVFPHFFFPLEAQLERHKIRTQKSFSSSSNSSLSVSLFGEWKQTVDGGFTFAASSWD